MLLYFINLIIICIKIIKYERIEYSTAKTRAVENNSLFLDF